MIPEPQHRPSVLTQAARPRRVRSEPHRLIVLTTIHLNDELCFNAGEVGYERTKRDLPAELVAAELAIAQVVPQGLFGLGG
jgi:hypothetical protein